MSVAAPDVTPNALKCIPTAADTLSLTPKNSAWANMDAWVEVSASSAAAWTIVGVEVNEPIADVDYEVDIGTGTVGNEVVIATVAGHSPTSVGGAAWNFLEFRIPIQNIAISTRVTIRMRKEGTSTTAWTMKLLYYDDVSSTVGVTANPTLCAPSNGSGPTVNVGDVSTAYLNGNWQEIHAGLTDIAALSLVLVDNTSLNAGDYEFDLGIGAFGAETVAATTGISFRNGVSSRKLIPFCIPIKLAGTNRISVRARRNVVAATDTVEIRLNYVSTSGFASTPSPRATTAIPFVSADAAALPTIAGANSAWVNSLYVELVASTSTACVLTGITVDEAAVVVLWEIDIAVGAASSEVVIATFADMTHSNVGVDNTIYCAIPIDAIPINSRVAARIRKTGTSTANWALGALLTPKPL